MARVAFIVDEGFEDAEFREPYDQVRAAGHEVVVVGTQAHRELHGKKGRETVRTDVAVRDVFEEQFDALVIPGGDSPDRLCADEEMLRFTRDFFDAEKPVAAICRAASLLVEADVVEGRTVTSWPSIRADLQRSGALWAEADVVEDENLITSRRPADLPALCDSILRHLEGKLSVAV